MLGGGSLADPPDDPVVIEAAPQCARCVVQLGDWAEAPRPERLLPQRADAALDVPVAFGLADEGRARLDAEGAQLVLEAGGDELGAMAVAQARDPDDADFIWLATYAASPQRGERMSRRRREGCRPTLLGSDVRPHSPRSREVRCAYSDR